MPVLRRDAKFHPNKTTHVELSYRFFKILKSLNSGLVMALFCKPNFNYLSESTADVYNVLPVL